MLMAPAGDPSTVMRGPGQRKSAAVRRARVATWVAFCITGLVAASWAGRVPAVQHRLGLTTGGLAVAVLGIEGGAVAGLPVGGAVVTRWGSRAGLRLGLAGYAPGLLCPALAGSLAWLTTGLAAWAAANSVVDVALNAQGVELERRYRRPVLSGLHAAQGIGLLLGACAATAAAALDVGLPAHLGAVAGTALIAGGTATLFLVREPSGSRRGSSRHRRLRPHRRLLLLGAVAFCAFLMDGSATDWIAVHLRADHGAGPGVAAAGYLSFTGGLVAARLAGDHLLLLHSRRTVVRACGWAAAVGAGIAVLAPTVAAAVAGWALVGLAVGPLAPTVLGAVPDAVRPHEHGEPAAVPLPVAMAAVTTTGYLGSFTGPPLVGVLAEAVGLPAALGLVALAGITAAQLAVHVPGPPTRP